MSAPPASSILAFVGSDEGRIHEEAHKAFGRLCPNAADGFSGDIIDGRAENADHAVRLLREAGQAVCTFSFFGGGKTVWLKAANFLDDSPVGRAESVKEAVDGLLALLAGGLPEGNHFILSATPVDKRRACFKALGKVAGVEVIDRPEAGRAQDEEKLLPWIGRHAAALGLRMSRDAVATLLALVGGETRRLDSELAKIHAYAGENPEVDANDVRAIVAPSRAGIVWNLGTAIGKRDLPDALAQLDQLLHDGENAVTIIRAAIIPKMRNLFLARDLARLLRSQDTARYDNFKSAVARLPEEETEHLPRNKAGEISLYPLFLALGESRRFSREELLEGLDACLDADYKLVFSSHPPPLVLSQLLTRLLSPRAATAATA